MFCRSCLKVISILSSFAIIFVVIGTSHTIAQENNREERKSELSSLNSPMGKPGGNPGAGSEAGLASVLKIGLVLSGGGARGVAHVGVLQWFEEHRIPVDYIAGTSMGGLVGGVYAMGMDSGEIRQLLNSIKWNEILSTGPSYQELAFRRKEDRRAFQTRIELGLRHGVGLPLGLSTDHYIGLLFDRLTLPYAGIKSFDELPTPYRCVATDFLKADQVVLGDGPLSTALRATMSIPGVFRPVERNGRVLVDGGLVNNIPTDVIKELGPDVVIAVDVGTPLGDLESISSLPGILSQAISVMLIQNDRRNLRLADVIIAPELGDHSILNFSAIDRLIDIGYQAAASKAAILQKFALDEVQWQQFLDRRKARRRTSVPIPDALEITGVGASAQKMIRRDLDKFIGHPLDFNKLEIGLTRITGQGRYESLQYSVLPDQPAPGRNLLLVRANQKYYAPPTLNFGLDLDSSDVNEINFTVGSRLTIYDIGKEGAEWRSDLRLGFNNIFASEYFIPVGEKGFFVAPVAAYRRERQDFFVGDFRAAQYQTERYGGGFDLGFVNRRSELRFGAEVGRLSARVRAGDPNALPPASGLISTARIRWIYDGQDSPTIPTMGTRLIAEGRWFFEAPDAPGSFGQAEVELSSFHPLSRRGSLFWNGSGGISFQHEGLGTHQFSLGGPFRLGAFNRDEFRGDRYLLVTTGYLHQLYQLPKFVGGKVYAGGWLDFGGADNRIGMNFNGNSFRNAISAGWIMDTLLGPFSIVGSFGEGGRGKVYFAIGKFF